jgi:histidinol-phosphate aminotransferase
MNITDKVPAYIRNLIPYNPGKPIEEVEREYGIEGCVKLASNENPLGPSPRAMKALAGRLAELNLYPDGDCFNLKRGLAAKLNVPATRLIFGNGSNEIIELAVRTFMSPGDEAIMDHFAFSIFRLVVQAAGGRCKIIPPKNFTVDLEAISRAVTPSTRILFLANPNNPTGTIYRKGEWEKFLERVGPEILLVVDEAYFEYVQEADYPNSLSYANEERAILTLRTFSKIYGLAGLRIGYGIGSEEIIGLMHRVRQPFNVNAPAQWAALAALEDDEYVKRALEVNQEGMTYLRQEIKKLGLGQVPSYGNFILVRVGSGQDCFQQLLRRGVIVRPMEGYDLPDYIRVTIGTMEENKRFIQKLGSIIGSKGSSQPGQ